MTQTEKAIQSDIISSSPIPLYYQAASTIRSQILTGEWPPGSRLPTEMQLSRKYGISRLTIRKAKALLMEQGLIKSIQGSGCYVNGIGKWQIASPTVDNLNDIFHIGSKMPFKIQEYGMIVNSDEIIAKLKNPQDQYVFQIKGIRFLQEQPLAYVLYYLPFQFGSKIPLERLNETPFIPQFEKLAGIQVKEGIQSVALGKADQTVAKLLNIKKGAPLLLIESVYYDEEHGPIEYVRSLCRDKLPYAIRVKRN